MHLLQEGKIPQHVNQRPVVYFPSQNFEKSTSTSHELHLSETKPVLEFKSGIDPVHKVFEPVHTSLLKGDDNTSIEPDQVFISQTPKEKASLLSQSSSVICFVVITPNPLLPSFYAISCDLKVFKTVVCKIHKTSRDAENVTFQSSSVSESDNTVLKCASQTYMSKLYMCDSFPGCSETQKEESICDCYYHNHLVKNNTFCNKLCHPSECKCPQLLRQRKHGGCENYQPENLYLTVVLPDHGSNSSFECFDGTSVEVTLFNDFVPDCTLGEDEPLLYLNAINMESLRYQCPEAGMHECHPGSIHCYSERDICHYKIDEQRKTLLPCRNGKHLDNCKQTECGHMFKCGNSFCIPYSYLCNGRWDCWNGDDENHCKSKLCVGLFKCRHSSMCIHLEDICNNILDCPLGDDEQCQILFSLLQLPGFCN